MKAFEFFLFLGVCKKLIIYHSSRFVEQSSVNNFQFRKIIKNFFPLVSGSLAHPTSFSFEQTSDNVCNECKSWISATQSFVSQEKTVDNVIEFAQNLFCEFYDLGNLTEQCRGVVDGYGRALLKDFIEEMNADDVCTMLIFCYDNEEALNFDNSIESMWPVKRHHKHQKRHHKHHKHPHRHHHKHHDRSACEFSINHARKMLNHHEADKATLRTLNSMCSSLQFSSNECSQFVEKQLRSTTLEAL